MATIPTKTSLISIDAILDQGKVSSGSKACDLGCGRSLFFLYALSTLVGQKGSVVGVDILDEIIDSAQRDIKHHKLTNISITRANIESSGSLKVLYNSIGAAFLINTLHQAENSLSMITESFKAIKAGGCLVIVDWNSQPSPIGPALERRVSEKITGEIVESLRPSKIEAFSPGPYHYGVTITK